MPFVLRIFPAARAAAEGNPKSRKATATATATTKTITVYLVDIHT